MDILNPFEVASRMQNLSLEKITTLDFNAAMSAERVGLGKSLSQLQKDIKENKSSNLKISPFATNLGVISDILCTKSSLPQDIASKHHTLILSGRKKLTASLDLSCANGSNVVSNLLSILDALPMLTKTIEDYLAMAEDSLLSSLSGFLSDIFGDFLTSIIMELFKDYILAPINCIIDNVLNNISKSLMSGIKTLEDFFNFKGLLKSLSLYLGGECIDGGSLYSHNDYLRNTINDSVIDACLSADGNDSSPDTSPYYYVTHNDIIPERDVYRSVLALNATRISKIGVKNAVAAIKKAQIAVLQNGVPGVTQTKKYLGNNLVSNASKVVTSKKSVQDDYISTLVTVVGRDTRGRVDPVYFLPENDLPKKKEVVDALSGILKNTLKKNSYIPNPEVGSQLALNLTTELNMLLFMVPSSIRAIPKRCVV